MFKFFKSKKQPAVLNQASKQIFPSRFSPLDTVYHLYGSGIQEKVIEYVMIDRYEKVHYSFFYEHGIYPESKLFATKEEAKKALKMQEITKLTEQIDALQKQLKQIIEGK